MSSYASKDIRAVSSDRNFGLVMAGFFALVGLVPPLHGGDLRVWALVLSAAFTLCAFLLPRALRPLNYLWHKLGLALHAVVNPVIMALIFYGAIVPMGVALRLLGRDLLRLKWDRSAKSYWIARRPGPNPQSMTKQF
ncbi:MAG TPA: SxtJ family membrane protein [Pseudolabrys sp.]|jgi:hypothetical protein|nr:SxtJ family membrane protein [Pseudolabrys sp.]